MGECFDSKSLINLVSLKLDFKWADLGIFEKSAPRHIADPQIIEVVDSRELRHHQQLDRLALSDWNFGDDGGLETDDRERHCAGLSRAQLHVGKYF